MKSATNQRLHSAEHSKNLSAARRANDERRLPKQQFPELYALGHEHHFRPIRRMSAYPLTAAGKQTLSNRSFGPKRSFGGSAIRDTVAARQGDRELSKCSGLGLDVYSATMLLDDDVMGHGEAKAGPFPRRLGGEEGIENLRSHLRRDAGAVVANPDFDRFAQVPSGRTEDRLKGFVARFGLARYRSIKPIGDKV